MAPHLWRAAAGVGTERNVMSAQRGCMDMTIFYHVCMCVCMYVDRRRFRIQMLLRRCCVALSWRWDTAILPYGGWQLRRACVLFSEAAECSDLMMELLRFELASRMA